MKLLLISPPPVCEYSREDADRSIGRTAEHTALYAARAKAVAEELNIPYVDLWTGFLRYVGWNEGEPLHGSKAIVRNLTLGTLIPDGLHFSSEGNRLCFQLVLEKIKEAYPELDPEKMEMKVPAWDDRDIFEKLRNQAESLQ
jgi:isoamyl acetate esterase